MGRKFSLFMILVLLAGMFLMPATAGAEAVITDGEQTATPRYSHRLIVELSSPPLAQYEGGAAIAAAGGRLDVASPEAQQYIQKLQAEQQAFVSAMSRAMPTAKVATFVNESGASVPATYQVLLNAVSVDAGKGADLKALERQLRSLPGVVRVSKDWAHDPDLYASLPLINAAAAWDNAAIGGKSNAGAGIKFASMDGGAHKDAPMFSGAGYTYPPGFPKGDTRGTNGKIILAKAYFRTWDPPSAGDENVWPGTRGTSHGNHTSSTVAGNEVTVSYLGADPVTLSGVAPKAYIMSYRVFYNSITNDGSFYNTEGIKALEDIVIDGADVLNNSWGGGPGSLGGEFDALDQALINAVQAGVFVSMSNGNAGPGLGTGDHPSADYINVAATSTTGTYAAGRLKVTAPEPVPADLQFMGYGTAQFGAALPVGAVLGPYNYVPAEAVAPTNIEGCSAFPAGSFVGKAALIRRGTCNFSLKVLNAQNAGASFAVIYNQASAGNTLITMAAGTGAADVTISSVLVGYTNGTKLVNWYTTNGAASQVALDTVAYQSGNTPDVVASFSSRGPGVGNVLKPDIAAPGVNILAQGYGLGSGEQVHLGFGQASGTSMAAPHVTGAAALIKQIHPTWSPAWIKSALMSTSKFMDIYNADGTPAQPLDIGAGRLDLTHAANPGVILDPPSLSFGTVETGATKTLEVTVTSIADTTETYETKTVYTGMGFGSLTTVDGLTVSPASITLTPGASAKLTVTWDTTAAKGEGDNQGYVLLDGAMYDAHLPAWMRAIYAPKPTVLEADLALEAGKDYSVIAAGELASGIEPVVLDDSSFNAPPNAGEFKIRFVHLSPDAPAVDIALKGGDVLFGNVAFKEAKDAAFPAGAYELEVRVAGTQTIALALPSITFEAGKIYTVYAMGKLVGPDGKKLQVVLNTIDPMAPLNGKARVRVVHSVVDAPPVSVYVNDGLAFFNVAWKDVTPYAALDAGTYNVKVKPAIGDVLVIDNDGSSSLGLDDYTPYYAAALDDLGVTYDIWDADEMAGNPVSIPDATTLSQYKAIVYQTGDNFRPNGSFTVPTPPTTLDMNRLVEYWNQGGLIIAFGQDLGSLTGGSSTSAPFFYSATLGARYLQDSVNGEMIFEDSAQLLTGLPGTPFGNTSFDISATGDGTGTNYYMDEVGTQCTDPDFTFCTITPLLKYSVGGNNVEEGYVALANRDFVTLERPGVSNLGKALYFTFGLEGVNSDTGFNTPKDLLGAALNWGWDKAVATIEADVNPVGDVSYFTALVDSTYGGDGVKFRWDFGDGTPFTNYYSSATAGHTYAKGGEYTVRVEAVNALGTHTIAEKVITVGQTYTTEVTKVFPAAADTFIQAGLMNTNFGASPLLYAGFKDINRTLMRFDLSSINADYPVEKAVLWVHVNAYGGGGSAADLQVFELTKAWAENTATWKTPWAMKGGDFTATAAASLPIVRTDVPKFMKFDITPLVQKWVADPSSNNGVVIRLMNETSVTLYRLGSKEYWVKDQRPGLEVTYKTP